MAAALNVFKGQRPDLTPAQVVAFVFGAVPYVLVLLGVDLGADKKDALDNLKVLAIGLFASDAIIRVGRNYAAGKQGAAPVEPDVLPEDLEDPQMDQPPYPDNVPDFDDPAEQPLPEGDTGKFGQPR